MKKIKFSILIEAGKYGGKISNIYLYIYMQAYCIELNKFKKKKKKKHGYMSMLQQQQKSCNRGCILNR